jgi:hypothetical protein
MSKTIRSLVVALALSAASSGAGLAAYYQGGQQALPECGFAATQDFGPNGYQACDARDVYSTR